jgi:hypothetical protein
MNSITKISTVQELLAFICEDANEKGNLSIRGVARLSGVAHTSIIRDGAFKSQKIAEKLESQGFECVALLNDGFPPQAVILTLEYFAYESKAKADQAKILMRTFGTLGLMEALNQVKKTEQPIVRQLPSRDTVDYIEAANKLSGLKVNSQLKTLLEDALTDELELMRNRRLISSNSMEKKEYTIAKVRAKELGYTEKQIGNGSALGRFIAKSLSPEFQKRIGDYQVNHYQVSPQLDEVIHAYFR